MFFSRSSFQVNSIRCQGLQCGFIGLVRYPESSRGGHLAVGQKSDIDLKLVNCLAKFGGLVRRNAKDSKSKLADLLIQFAQLNQLPFAARSPPAAVEDNDSGLFSESRSKIKFRSV